MSPPMRALTSISRGRPSTRRSSTCCTPSVMPRALTAAAAAGATLGQERVVGIDGVPGLVEVRGGAEVFAGHGDRCGRALVGDAFDREFRPVEVLLDQDAGVLTTAARAGRGERERGGQLFGMVDADHADAAGERGGLDDDRVAQRHRGEAGLAAGSAPSSRRLRALRGGRTGCVRWPCCGRPASPRASSWAGRAGGRGGRWGRGTTRPGDHAGQVVARGQRPAAGEQCCRVAQVDDGVVDDERLLPQSARRR